MNRALHLKVRIMLTFCFTQYVANNSVSADFYFNLLRGHFIRVCKVTKQDVSVIMCHDTHTETKSVALFID